MSSDKATAKGSLLGAWLPKEHTTRVAEFIQRSNLRSKMSDDETQAGSPPVVVPNPNEQSLRDHFERILLISEEAAAALAEQVMEVFTEKCGVPQFQLPQRTPGQTRQARGGRRGPPGGAWAGPGAHCGVGPAWVLEIISNQKPSPMSCPAHRIGLSSLSKRESRVSASLRTA